ncbi:SMI1/KNR4 family protein [Paenibacillus sp. NAIST15-1]|uniref:SMI1/KNR4 family protein n=1 Tax=Paenibacillus TaxID=44249 RepID=UPI0009F91BC0
MRNRPLLGIAAEYEFDAISYQKDHIQEVTWSPGWIPINANGSVSYIALDLAPGPSGTKGQAINSGRDEQETVVIADSLGTFYSLIIEKFSKQSAADTIRRSTLSYGRRAICSMN